MFVISVIFSLFTVNASAAEIADKRIDTEYVFVDLVESTPRQDGTNLPIHVTFPRAKSVTTAATEKSNNDSLDESALNNETSLANTEEQGTAPADNSAEDKTNVDTENGVHDELTVALKIPTVVKIGVPLAIGTTALAVPAIGAAALAVPAIGAAALAVPAIGAAALAVPAIGAAALAVPTIGAAALAITAIGAAALAIPAIGAATLAIPAIGAAALAVPAIGAAALAIPAIGVAALAIPAIGTALTLGAAALALPVIGTVIAIGAAAIALPILGLAALTATAVTAVVLGLGTLAAITTGIIAVSLAALHIAGAIAGFLNPFDTALTGFIFPIVAIIRNLNHVLAHSALRLLGAANALANPADLAVNGFAFPVVATIRNLNHVLAHTALRIAGALAALANPLDLGVNGFAFPVIALLRNLNHVLAHTALRLAGALAALLNPADFAVNGFAFPITAMIRNLNHVLAHALVHSALRLAGTVAAVLNPWDLGINGFLFPITALVRNFNHILWRIVRDIFFAVLPKRIAGYVASRVNPYSLPVIGPMIGFLFPDVELIKAFADFMFHPIISLFYIYYHLSGFLGQLEDPANYTLNPLLAPVYAVLLPFSLINGFLNPTPSAVMYFVKLFTPDLFFKFFVRLGPVGTVLLNIVLTPMRLYVKSVITVIGILELPLIITVQAPIVAALTAGFIGLKLLLPI